MLDREDRIIDINIEDEMKTAYIDYSMSVIVSRALPDVRDGFKPVHRRVLYAMNETGNTFDKPTRKCANAVGEVLGKYHPHGDSSVYGTLVRLAQPWNLRYPLMGLALTFPILLFVQAFGMLIGVGASSRVSILLGEGKHDEAENILSNALLLTIVTQVLTQIGRAHV